MQIFSANWRFSFRDMLITASSLAVTALLYVLLHDFSEDQTYVPLLFVSCVLVVSRFTEGYLPGILAAIIAVLGVNYMFTYPYMTFNFTIAGYPLTFATMLAVAVSTSTLTTHIKQQEKLKLESIREKMRANLLRAISHDLRTPLTAISGSINAVLDNHGLPYEKKHALLVSARDDAEWLIRMTENLLSVTRIGSGEAELRKMPEAAEEIVAEVVRKFRKRFSGVEVLVSAPEDVLFVPMDAILIEQVLGNLLENSVLHGECTQCIRLAVEKSENWAVFSVSDDGNGISREAFSKLFTDYFDMAQRLDNSGEKRNTGIGLSVCKTIIEAHGGTISAQNLPDGGAQFAFRLPLC